MKKNQIAAMLLAGIFAAAQPVAALQAAPETKQLSIKIDGLLQRTAYLPMNIEGTTMVEAETLFEILGVTNYIISTETGRVTFYFQNKVVDFTAGSKTALVSGNEMALTVAPYDQNGKIYLPLRYTAERCNATVGWTAETSTITLDTIAADYSVIEAVERSEDTANTVTYTLKDAVAKIMKESNDMKTYDQAIRDTKEKLDDDDGELLLNTMKNRTTDENAFELRDQDRYVSGLYDTIERNNIYKVQFERNTEADLVRQAIAIEDAKYDIMLLEKKLELDALNIKNMEVKASLGYETETNIKTQKDNLEQSKINLAALKTALSNAKMELNNTVGVPYDKEVIITYTAAATPLAVTDLTKYIKDKTEKSCSIQLLAVDLRYQATVKRTHEEVPQGIREEAASNSDGVTTGAKEKTETVEANYNTAAAKLKTAKDAMELNLRTAYNQLQGLDETYQSKKIELEKAIDAYNTVSVNYETGGAVIYDVLTAQMNLLNAEAALEQNRLDYAAARYSFENPS
ncbi:MAG: TolC family protein [Clostridiales bacterium]|jgi:hypothetical protein|nr:TolC family protein [Clostridiales bacterium]